MVERARRVAPTLIGAVLLLPAAVTGAEGLPPVPALAPALPAQPAAAASECFGKLRIAARYDEVPIEVTVRDASERFELTPARFEDGLETVTLRDAATTIAAHQPVLGTETIDAEQRPAGTRWVRGGLGGEQPPSEEELQALLADGIDPQTVPPGSCAIEHYKSDSSGAEPVQVLVHEAYETYEIATAVFSDEQQAVTLVPEHSRLVEVPAIWRDKRVDVVVEAARSSWTPDAAPVESAEASGSRPDEEPVTEIVRRIDVPAVVESVPVRRLEMPALVTRVSEAADVEMLDVKRLVSDATLTRHAVPARFETIEIARFDEPGLYRWALDETDAGEGFEPTGRRVCLRETEPAIVSYERGVVLEPGGSERTRQAALTRDVPVQRLVADASFRTMPVAAQTRTMTRRALESDERLEWQPVPCVSDVTPDLVRRLQQALQDEGYSPNGVDGVLGPGTLGAVDRLQRDESLATGGLSMEMFRHLDVPLRSAADAGAIDVSTEEP